MAAAASPARAGCRVESRTGHRARGSALVIVLLFVILLTGLTIAFLSRSLTAARVSSSSAGETKASILANSAGDIVIGDFKQEIIARLGQGHRLEGQLARLLAELQRDHGAVPERRAGVAAHHPEPCLAQRQRVEHRRDQSLQGLSHRRHALHRRIGAAVARGARFVGLRRLRRLEGEQRGAVAQRPFRQRRAVERAVPHPQRAARQLRAAGLGGGHARGRECGELEQRQWRPQRSHGDEQQLRRRPLRLRGLQRGRAAGHERGRLPQRPDHRADQQQELAGAGRPDAGGVSRNRRSTTSSAGATTPRRSSPAPSATSARSPRRPRATG